MATPQPDPVSPKATPLRPLPSEDPLTPEQWNTLLAVADAIIPAITPASAAKPDSEQPAADTDYAAAVSTLRARIPESDADAESTAKGYLADVPSQHPAFRAELQRIFAVYMPVSQRNELLMVLSALDTRAGSLVMTGYLAPISAQPVHIRQSILRSWQDSRIWPLRQLHSSLAVLSKQAWVKTSPALQRVLGVPRVPVGMKPGKDYDYEFIHIPPGDEPEVIETDVLVVGSGCGGGVSAKNLAEVGHRVLIVEKGYHWTPDHFPMTQADGWNHLFMNGAFLTSDDGALSIVAGETWGGGGTVNWSASLQTQGYVRREWAAQGLPFFTSADFQQSLDRVCERMGVSAEHIKHNPANQILLEGARKLGWTAKPVPQNTGGKQHYCGHCTFGCGSCEKQGPAVSFLPDAARAGARFLEGFHAEKVLFSNERGSQIATGVEGTWVSRDINGGVAGTPMNRRKVVIKAKRVVVSAGTMQSPLLLMRSGLSNPHIGRNLYVHPVTFVGAYHKQDIKPWEGGILTSVVGEFENLDGQGHGVKLEATNMAPSACLMWVQSNGGGLQYKLDAARLKHMVGYISIAKDRDSGRVYADPVDGKVRFSYPVSKFDRQHILEGLLGLAKIQYVEGAEQIFTTQPGLRPFIRNPSAADGDGINDAEFQVWLDEVRAKGLPSPESMFISAHQMGTCRMSARERDGVVDPQGKVWGTEGLYVADASVFPSASGVNPMVTNMAISDWISRGIAKGLEERSRL
ncbi:hypothetical protein ACJQWK_06557 [Exserohilum turcicum]|uniref:Long-chain-alcohol oxidase n=1 Tax=Exserohilum turcicum (strain 28A) TaxID=671987 RepID=R0K6H8_EXST2|nr:uncharacterized protein SETTUDRAFT_20639 [Exserohilum turcica Et28A]EOA85119.1 hypothetical protein SETTUDRAFT_20639 [Exserohilum turcica Et28A]